MLRQLQPAEIGGLIELEIESPHMIRMRGTQQAAVETTRTALLVLARWWAAQPFLTPQAAQLLVIHHPALAAHHCVGLAPSQTGMVPCKAAKPTTQLHIVSRDRTRWASLGGTMLTHDPTGPTL